MLFVDRLARLYQESYDGLNHYYAINKKSQSPPL
jgi:hypothetical protein